MKWQGRLSVQAGALFEKQSGGGSGVLLGEVAGVPSAKVVILGAGAVGTQAARVALGMGANVVVLDKSLNRLKRIETLCANKKLITSDASSETIEKHLSNADLVIGAVLVPGATAPKLVSRAMLHRMRARSVIIDVSIDQGGCFETSHATTHAEPTFVEEEIVHYCVVNMPAGVPRTATLALNNATLPFIMALADKGYRAACLENPHLLAGLNVCQGKITYERVALALNKTYTPVIF